MAQVVELFISLRHRLPMKPVQQARALVDRGLEGCAHNRLGGRRQVLLMDSETLEEFELKPGDVKENITTRGLVINGLPPGERLRVGGAILEVTLACQPCGRMDDIRPGLQQVLRGRRGMLCRVVQEGEIRRGDAIELIAPALVVS